MKIYVHTKTSRAVFLAALSIIVTDLEMTQMSIQRCVANQRRHSHTTEHYSAMTRNAGHYG